STCTRESSSLILAATGVPSVGTLWSAVASVRSGRRTLRPASLSPSNACGLVTSCTRCRSMYRIPGATSCASQILSNRVLGIGAPLAPPEAGADHRQQHRPIRSWVLEMMGQVGVERHAVALVELMGLAVAYQHDGARLDQRA